MKKLTFDRTFTVGEESKHEYEHYVDATAKLLKRPYMQVHRLVTGLSLDEIKRRYTLSTKHNGDIPSDVYWWWLRKKQ